MQLMINQQNIKRCTNKLLKWFFPCYKHQKNSPTKITIIMTSLLLLDRQESRAEQTSVPAWSFGMTLAVFSMAVKDLSGSTLQLHSSTHSTDVSSH